MIRPPEPIVIDPHFPPSFYAALWCVSVDTAVRWFQDEPGVLKVGETGKGKKVRIELRIPYSLAMRIYAEKTK